MENVLKLDRVEQYNDLVHYPTLHPLVSVIDFSKCPKARHARRMYGFYCVFLKDVKCGDMRYGRHYYDYQEGTLVFLAPGQCVGFDNRGVKFQPKGWALLFHPDLLRGTHDRVTEMDFTIPAVRGYAEKIKASGFDGVLINITNPCDIVTRELALGLGLPRGRVFGTGTGLDTSRLLSALARQTGIDHKSITCYMLGEHGNQQFAPWSCVSFRGMPLDVWAEKDARFRFDRDALQKESIGGGWVTFSGKLCTEYGIATTAARMAHLVLHDEKAIMPASAELCGEYGESGLFAGVPCVIGAGGVEQVVELPLTKEEAATFHACCEGIRANMAHLNDL